MFYVREISGALQPYQPGAIRERRIVRAVAEVNAPESVDLTASFEPTRSESTGARGVVFGAYARAQNPDGQRRRVVFARELMTTSLVTAAPETPLLEIQRIFAQRRFRHLPVVAPRENQIVGILSDRDLLRRMVNAFEERQEWETVRASDLMAHPVLVASEDSEVRELARVMFEERVGCVPIVDQQPALVGIVTRSDILRTLLVQAPLELWR